MRPYYRSFKDAIHMVGFQLFKKGKPVHVGHWQGVDVKNRPDMTTYEVLDISFTGRISSDLDVLREQINPNLPWADDHFLERVGGIGLNPGEQYKNWPFYRNKANDVHRTEREKFTHTYMERFWPNNIEGLEDLGERLLGIRYEYGDLDDLVRLLAREPFTRQAFLPVWYPEDTGARHGGRVPCTLGYHFMLRDGELHMWYPMRACDYIRHFRDDIYLSCRLLLWVLDKLREIDPDTWGMVRPGLLTMQIYSLHIFATEVNLLKRSLGI